MAAQLAEAKEQGASGLKVFKNLGLEYRNPDGSLMRVDDPRWDPIWEACGNAGAAGVDSHGRSAGVLSADRRDQRTLGRAEAASRVELSRSRVSRLRRADRAVAERRRAPPATTFIGAHVASSAEDLASVGQWLDTYPNLNVDIAARIAELGRQPYTARRFFLKYADRILFGTDGPRVVERLAYHWRFLETDDEYFRYAENAVSAAGILEHLRRGFAG